MHRFHFVNSARLRSQRLFEWCGRSASQLPRFRPHLPRGWSLENIRGNSGERGNAIRDAPF